MQRSIAITKEGWYYLGMMGFVIAGAMIRDINLLYIMAGMMLGPLVYSAFAASRSIRNLRLQRRFPAIVGVGEPLHVEVQASKPAGARRGLAVLVTDQIRYRKTKPQSAQLFFSEVGPKEPVENSYCVRIRRRGEYLLGPISGSTAMPIGLVRATATLGDRDKVLVSPPLGILQPAWTKQLNLNSEGGQKSVRRHGQAEGDFYGMREWRDGDSRNWIHWRTSAKRNKLTVRQFEQRTNQDVVVVLDMCLPKNQLSAELEATLEKLESAVSFAATVVVQQCKQMSTQLTVAAASENGFLIHGVSSPAFRREVMERMAIIEATQLDRLPELVAEVFTRITTNTRVVLVTAQDRDLEDTQVFEALWRTRAAQGLVGQIITVNVLSDDFDGVFRLEGNPHKPIAIGDAEPTEAQEVAS